MAHAVPAPWEVVHEADAPILVMDLLLHARLVSTKSEARRVITQGGAYVNGEKVTSLDRALTRDDLQDGRLVALRRGKRHAALIEVLDSPDDLDAATPADLVLLRIPDETGDGGGPHQG